MKVFLLNYGDKNTKELKAFGSVSFMTNFSAIY